ncbi:IS630 family transposase [Ochrobactrum sp. S1502_03]|uniref:IS630 family transposase n=1 Tax=Ochrobactrum sp. S1502_03 TaxID=3108451 RepID=UPI0037C913E2
MSKALSVDLRVRVLAAVAAGATHRDAAERFGVSAASVSRWRNLQLRQGDVRPGPLGGDRNSRKTEAHGEAIMAWLAEHRDGTLFELRDALSAQGITISKSALHRFLVRHGQTRKKKTGHAVEQSRPDVLEQRQQWFDDQLDLDPAKLVFIDETWTATNMARTHGRCRKGERLRMGFPHGHRKTTTLVAGLRSTGMVAPLVIDGPINGEWFEAYIAQVLVPTLKPGDVVILDNLSSHKRPAAREMIEAAGARMLFLPPYSPDFNPIEKAFSKLKALLRKAAERTVTGLWDRIGKLIDLVVPQEARNFFTSCGYDPT